MVKGVQNRGEIGGEGKKGNRHARTNLFQILARSIYYVATLGQKSAEMSYFDKTFELWETLH